MWSQWWLPLTPTVVMSEANSGMTLHRFRSQSDSLRNCSIDSNLHIRVQKTGGAWMGIAIENYLVNVIRIYWSKKPFWTDLNQFVIYFQFKKVMVKITNFFHCLQNLLEMLFDYISQDINLSYCVVISKWVLDIWALGQNCLRGSQSVQISTG